MYCGCLRVCCWLRVGSGFKVRRCIARVRAFREQEQWWAHLLSAEGVLLLRNVAGYLMSSEWLWEVTCEYWALLPTFIGKVTVYSERVWQIMRKCWVLITNSCNFLVLVNLMITLCCSFRFMFYSLLQYMSVILPVIINSMLVRLLIFLELYIFQPL